MRQRTEERRRYALQVGLGLTHDIATDEFRRILEHVDEAVQFAQHIVRNVARSARLAVQKDRNFLVAAADFLHEGAQFGNRLRRFLRTEFLVIDRQDERRSATLLLGKRGEIAVTGHPQHFKAFSLDRVGQRTNTQTRSVFRTEIFVDDDDGEMKMHGDS